MSGTALPLTLFNFLGHESKVRVPLAIEDIIEEYFKQLLNQESNFLIHREFQFRNDFGHNTFSYNERSGVRTPYLAICHDYMEEPPRNPNIIEPCFFSKDGGCSGHFYLFFENLYPNNWPPKVLCKTCRLQVSHFPNMRVVVCLRCFPSVVAFIRFFCLCVSDFVPSYTFIPNKHGGWLGRNIWFLDNFGIVTPEDHFDVQFREHTELIWDCYCCRQKFKIVILNGENTVCKGCGCFVLRYKK